MNWNKRNLNRTKRDPYLLNKQLSTESHAQIKCFINALLSHLCLLNEQMCMYFFMSIYRWYSHCMYALCLQKLKINSIYFYSKFSTAIIYSKKIYFKQLSNFPRNNKYKMRTRYAFIIALCTFEMKKKNIKYGAEASNNRNFFFLFLPRFFVFP